MRIPVVTQEPVHVTGDIPNNAYEQKRVSMTGFAMDTYQEKGPPNGFYWLLDSINFDATTDANAGNRDFYLYARDKNGNAIRFRFLRLAATSTAYYISNYGSSVTWDVSSALGTFPLPFAVMQFPCKVGLLKTTFHGAGDTCNVHFMVREYKVY